VIATILLLALTVTLFASIFAFVTAFPQPPPQNNNQFQASLAYTANLTYVTGIRILHLAGPAVAGTGLIYLKSATHPAAPEFQVTYTVSSGLAGSSQWNLGQVWNLTFPVAQRPQLPDNITVYVVASSQLLFSVILPGTTVFAPATIVSTSISPATPTKAQSFTVYATLAGAYNLNSVYVNLAGVPGGPSTPQKMTQNSQGQWTYLLSTGATSNGTFYGFVNATGFNGGQATGAVVILISNAGSSNGPLSVAVIPIPSPPNPLSPESVQAVVTYTGSLLNAPLNVTFAAVSSGSAWSGFAPSGLTISGPTSVTAASKSLWTVPATASPTVFSIYANATVTGVGAVSGVMTFTSPSFNLAPAGGLVGSTVTGTGTGYAPGTGVTIAFAGNAVTPTSCSVGTLSGATVTTTGAGAFTCSFKVPGTAPGGADNAIASDATSGQNDTAVYTVTAWTISPLNPTSGLVGVSVTVTGTGFVASSTLTLAFQGIAITPVSCSVGTLAGSTITATAPGAFTCIFKIPNGATPGAGSLVAADTGGPTATAPFTVTAWTFTLSPATGIHTSAIAVTMTGAGFAVSSTVVFSYNGASITPSACSTGTLAGTNTVTTTAGGAFVCTYTIASGGTAGTYLFTATDTTSGQTLTAAFVRT